MLQRYVTPFLTHWQDGRSEGWLPRNVLIVEPGSGPGQNPFAMAIFPGGNPPWPPFSG